MGSEASDQMMELLQELSMLKKLDDENEGFSDQSDPEAHRLRQQRHEEITQQMKALAQQKQREEKA
jgi:hypothetical protein